MRNFHPLSAYITLNKKHTKIRLPFLLAILLAGAAFGYTSCTTLRHTDTDDTRVPPHVVPTIRNRAESPKEEPATLIGKEGQATAANIPATPVSDSPVSVIPPMEEVAKISSDAEAVLTYARKYLGSAYRYGSPGPTAFDCSGFTSYVYRHFGYELQRSSSGQFSDGHPTGGTLQPGDLVFFSGRRGGTTIGHVGIYIAPDPDGKSFSFIHASTSAGVIVSHLSEPYYQSRYKGARRILPDGSLPPSNPGGSLPPTPSQGGGEKTAGNTHAMTTASPNTPSLGGGRGEASSAPERGEASYHTIRKGDTLSKIARQYGTTVTALCRLNGISQTTILSIGKKLKVK